MTQEQIQVTEVQTLLPASDRDPWSGHVSKNGAPL